jgi:uncharacterized protein with PQ loop repeat
MLISS